MSARPARSAGDCQTVPDLTGYSPHIACVSPGAFRNTSAQPDPIRLPNREAACIEDSPSCARGLGSGEQDRETLPQAPMCVLRRPRPRRCSQSRRGRPQASPRGGERGEGASPQRREQGDASWAHSAGEWGHGNLSTAVGSDPGPDLCHLESSRLCVRVSDSDTDGESTPAPAVAPVTRVPAPLRPHPSRALDKAQSRARLFPSRGRLCSSCPLVPVPATWRRSRAYY